MRKRTFFLQAAVTSSAAGIHKLSSLWKHFKILGVLWRIFSANLIQAKNFWAGLTKKFCQQGCLLISTDQITGKTPGKFPVSFQYKSSFKRKNETVFCKLSRWKLYSPSQIWAVFSC